MKIKSLFLCFALIMAIMPSFFCSCVEEERPIPYRDVFIRRNIDIYKIVNYGSYLYIDKRELERDRIGYGGILVLKAMDGFYYAFDLACTKEKDASIKIGKPNAALVCKCPVCSEEYDLSFGLGVPSKGISKLPLQRYNVSIDEYNYLIITQ